MKPIRSLTFAMVAALAITVPALAAEPTALSGKRAPRDPNEVVCERQEELGSRLSTRKVCMTRAEWKAKQQSDRDVLRGAQISACTKPEGC